MIRRFMMHTTHGPFRITHVVAVLMLLAFCFSAFSPAVAQPSGADIDGLIDAMTLDEKLTMLHGIGFFGAPARCLGSAGYVAGVERLGIPGLCMADGPAGVRVSESATAMSAPVSLAATFDPGLAYAYGRVIGREGRALGQDVLLSPMVNLVRVPYAGRNFETMGEDPYLANQIMDQEVSGIQGEGLIATIKHYAANNQENNRGAVSANVDEQTLHELYLPGFEGAINAGSGAVMCAYNRVNGTYACENAYLLTEVLRDQWGFEGWVMTDWFANHPSGIYALPAGLDMEMPGEVAFGGVLKAAIEGGVISEELVDQAVRRILVQMDHFGLLQGASPDGGTPMAPPRPSIDVEADAAVAREVATAGAVLLKNDGKTLPLKYDDLRQLVVIGPTAQSLLVGGGGSARVIGFVEREISPLDALIELAGPKATITFVPGIDLDGVPVPASVLTPEGGAPGDQGLLRTNPDGTTTIDPQVNFTDSLGNAFPPGSGTYTWSGTITIPTTGEYEIKLQTAGTGFSFFPPFTEVQIDGSTVVSAGGFFGGPLIPTSDGLTNNSASVTLEAGEHTLQVTGVRSSTDPLQIRLAWVTPEWRQAKFDEAVAAATAARAVVVFGYNEGSEGVDRPSIALPGAQDALIQAVVEANPRSVVVLNTGDPVSMPWVDSAAAILQMWYPGQEGGWATADLLLGNANPGGKLPVTFPVSDDDTQVAGHPEMYPGVDNEQYYSEGIFAGYRWYDAQDIEPLFPFGHGLSYTKFDYSKLNVSPSSAGGFDVTFRVHNVGNFDGDEVAQVYLGPSSAIPAGVQMAEKALVAFTRVSLKNGEWQDVTLHVAPRWLSYWSADADEWVIAGGSREVVVGSSSRDLRLQEVVEVGP
jgi:beta-glucosidase